MALDPHDVEYFPAPQDFRAWLEIHHGTCTELWMGFYKKATGKPSPTWSESVDQALCFGWIDGIRVSIDDERYANRFTPRKPGSNWSAVNLQKVAALAEQGLMMPAGMAAYEARQPEKSQEYSYENRHIPLGPENEAAFRADRRAWEFFESQAPWYQRTAAFWVMSAKRKETRKARLAQLIDDSAAGRRIKQLDQSRRKPARPA